MGLIFALCLLPTFARLIGGFAEFTSGGGRYLACFLRDRMGSLADFTGGRVGIFLRWLADSVRPMQADSPRATDKAAIVAAECNNFTTGWMLKCGRR